MIICNMRKQYSTHSFAKGSDYTGPNNIQDIHNFISEVGLSTPLVVGQVCLIFFLFLLVVLAETNYGLSLSKPSALGLHFL